MVEQENNVPGAEETILRAFTNFRTCGVKDGIL